MLFENLSFYENIYALVVIVFIAGGFILPLVAQCIMFAWAFINDSKVGINPVHRAYFIKILGCSGPNKWITEWQDGKKWLSTSNDYDSVEFYGHHMIHSVMLVAFFAITVNFLLIPLIIMGSIAGIFLARKLVRIGKKLAALNEKLNTHVSDKSVHR